MPSWNLVPGVPGVPSRKIASHPWPASCLRLWTTLRLPPRGKQERMPAAWRFRTCSARVLSMTSATGSTASRTRLCFPSLQMPQQRTTAVQHSTTMLQRSTAVLQHSTAVLQHSANNGERCFSYALLLPSQMLDCGRSWLCFQVRRLCGRRVRRFGVYWG